MKNIKLKHMAQYLGISTSFLCEVRKGKKSFSKQMSKSLSEKTGVPLEKLLYTNGESLYRAIVVSFATTKEVKRK